MSFSLTITPTAQRDFRSQPVEVRKELRKIILEIKDDPMAQGSGPSLGTHYCDGFLHVASDNPSIRRAYLYAIEYSIDLPASAVCIQTIQTSSPGMH
jgi:hypothetical protein